MRTRAPKVAEWVERLSCMRPYLTPSPVSSNFPTATLEVAVVMQSLRPILDHLLTDYLPVLEGTVKGLTKFLNENPTKHNIPRSLGMQTVAMRLDPTAAKSAIVTSRQSISSFAAWKLQRVQDCVAAMPPSDRARVRSVELLGSMCGGRGPRVLELDTGACRVERFKNKLIRATNARRLSKL